ncbi:MAG: ABC transporter ATP-binding protein [Bacteroidota bacterium]
MILEGYGLSKCYGKLHALDNVNVSCEAGRIYGLLGANGAGKTTLFKILLGLIRPDSGEVVIHSKREKPLGGIIEKPAAYEYLSAHQNLRLFSRVQGAQSDQATINQQLAAVGLPVDRTDPVRNFSMGMKQRLGIAIAMLNSPECLILDEPFSGLDPLGIESLRELIQDLAASRGISVIVSSHIIDQLSKLSDELIILKSGKLVNRGITQDIISASTMSYTICGTGIGELQEWGDYQVSVSGQCAKVTTDAQGIGEVIEMITAKGLRITSCSPDIDMSRLFDPVTT